MLWSYSLNFKGFIEADADITAARNTLIAKLQNDPGSFISKLEPAEPPETPGLWRMVVGMTPKK